jgi:hypothetical protein
MWIKGGFIQQPNGARRLISHRTQLIISLRNVDLNGHTSRPRPLGLSPKALVAAQPPHSARGGPLWQREKSLFLCAREMRRQSDLIERLSKVVAKIYREKKGLFISALFSIKLA